MSISKLRVDRALAEAKSTLLKYGEPVTLDKLRGALKDTKPAGAPITDLLRFPKRGSFSIDKHNEFLSQCQADYEVLTQALLDQLKRCMQIIQSNTVKSEETLYQARTLRDLLQHELARLTDTHGYFVGAFDTFKDLATVNQTVSTVELDLGTESVRLAKNKGSSKRLRLDHLVGEVQVPISFSNPGDVLSHRTVPGEIFGNCFDSLERGFQQQIVSSKPDGLSLGLTVDFGSTKDLSRVVIDPLVPNVELSGVSTSLDGVNFVQTDLDRKVSFDEGKVSVSLDFGQPRMVFYDLRIAKPTSEAIQDGEVVYIYHLGIRELEFYVEAYAESSILQSTVRTPESEASTSTIDKVTLAVEEELPEGTTIEYEVAPSTDPTNFRAISSLGRLEQDKPSVLNFNQIAKQPASDNIIELSSSTQHTFTGDVSPQSKNGVTFWDIYTFPNTPIFKTVQVRRGLNGWKITNRTGLSKERVERGNALNFSSDTPNSLYVNVYGEEILLHQASDGSTDTKLRTQFSPLDDSGASVSSTQARPEAPRYVVGRLVLRPSSETRTVSYTYTGATDGVSIGIGTVEEGLEGRKIILFPNGLGFPAARVQDQHVRLDYLDKSGTQIEGVFRVLQVLTDNQEARLVLEDLQDILEESGSSTVNVSIESVDVTAEVASVDSTGITVDSGVEIKRGDVFVVDYRRKLRGSEELVSASVVVTDSVDNSIQYEVGKDFVIDPLTKTVSRVPESDMPDNVRASYTYISKDTRLRTYTTYVSVATGKEVKIDTAGFVLDEEESSILYTPFEEIPLNQAQKIQLGPGLYKVEVVSKAVRRDDSGVNTDTAFYKTVNLTDQGGAYVFSPGRHFSRIEGSINSMTEVSLFDLKFRVGKYDTKYFAVDADTLVFNFDPLSSDSDVVTLLPGSSTVLARESMAVGYDYLPTNHDSITGVILRATLRQLPGADSRKTPTLHSYDLRFIHV